jgi:3-oxoacyl-(acyl-carrier-protein) synthase
MNKKKRVVITGFGVVSPIGTGLSEFRTNLFDRQSGIQYINELQELGFACCIGGRSDIKNSKHKKLIDIYHLEKSSKTIQFAILAAAEAWTSAGLDIPDNQSGKPDYNTGAIIGSGMGALDQIGDQVVPNCNAQKRRKLRSTIIEQCMPNGASAHVAMILGLGNKVSSVSSACATSTEAIITAAEHISAGKADRMLAGGTEAYSPYSWIGFDIMRVLNRKSNTNPTAGSAPMSEYASGFVPAEGAGILLLESLDSALERNVPILAEISGTHINSGGLRNGGTMTAPSSEAVIKCVRESINDAGIKAADIDYINGHLSSTMADVLEIQNLTKALNRYGKDFPYINSLKAQTGHCIGAGGAIESIAGILQLQAQKVAASVNSKPLHPEIAKLINDKSVPNKAINHPIKHLLKTSFGFGDVNACMVISKYSKS